MEGNFSISSRNIQLIDGHILSAECRDWEGNWVASALDLDREIGNRNGELEWGGFNFSKSSEDIKLVDGTTIVAKARRWDGTMEHASISLNDLIRNENGCLIMVPGIPPP